MKKNVFIFVLTCFLSNVFAQNHQVVNSEIEVIKRNYVSILLYENKAEQELINVLTSSLEKEEIASDQMIVELMQRYPVSNTHINYLIDSMRDDGTWADINYEDNRRSGWEPKNHAEKILELAKAYRSSDPEFKNSFKVEQTIKKSLDYWFRTQPVSPNWWHNQIGVPKTLGGVFILFEDKLTEQEREQAIKVMEQAKFGMTGQNKVWLAGNVLVKALLQNNYNLVKEARNIIISEVTMGDQEGIKEDRSFHQHGAQQQFGNYGAAYITSMAFWSSMFKGTTLSFTQKEYDILSTLINDGYRRVLWKGNMDINALGRQFFINAQKLKAFAVLFASNALSEADNVNKEKYKELIARNSASAKKKKPELYHFWQSDQTVFRKENYMVSVKMSSPRVIGGEAGNGDNLKGYYVADGATYTYVNGNEYTNIFPCWDWQKLPGVTAHQTNLPLKQLTWGGYHNKNNFVGNVTDGLQGVTAMSLDRDKLTAKKAWFFTNDFVVCLGAGIKSDSACTVTTSIEQCVKYNEEKIEPVNNTERYLVNNTGYIVLDPKNVKQVTEERTGKWSEIMNTYPPEYTETKQVFSLWFDHGVSPKNGEYAYIILPNANAAQVKKFKRSDIDFFNNNAAQAVHISKENITYLAAYTPNNHIVYGKLDIKVKQPGLFIIKHNGKKITEVWVADPTQKLEKLQVIINNKNYNVKLPTGKYKGTSVKLQAD